MLIVFLCLKPTWKFFGPSEEFTLKVEFVLLTDTAVASVPDANGALKLTVAPLLKFQVCGAVAATGASMEYVPLPPWMPPEPSHSSLPAAAPIANEETLVRSNPSSHTLSSAVKPAPPVAVTKALPSVSVGAAPDQFAAVPLSVSAPAPAHVAEVCAAAARPTATYPAPSIHDASVLPRIEAVPAPW